MICLIEKCNRLPRTLGMCGMHYQRFWKHGDPLIVKPAGRREQGEDIGYVALHDRLVKYRGRAAEHTCRCGQPAEHWAYDHLDPNEKHQFVGGYPCPYSVDLTHYEALCISCHRRQDFGHSHV